MVVESAVRSCREVRRWVLWKEALSVEVTAVCSLRRASMLWSVKD
jgi:hypothetical protein